MATMTGDIILTMSNNMLFEHNGWLTLYNITGLVCITPGMFTYLAPRGGGGTLNITG